MTDTPRAVAEERRLLDTVLATLARLTSARAAPDLDRRLTELRDSLAEEKLPEDIASLAEEMDRLTALRAQQQRSLRGEVDLRSPYFGHLKLRDERGERAVLLGKETFLSDRVRIVDWRNAPISRIFYQYAEGDEYDVEIAGRDVHGEVLVRRTVTIQDGELQRVGTHEQTWVREEDGSWRDLREHEARLAGGAGAAVRASSLGTGHAGRRRDKHLPDIASLLDPEQFDLITRPESGVVVIQGSAGSGKTTVGLHRIAYLNFRSPGRFRPARILVMVFSPALASYIGQVLPALGVEGVQVAEYGSWAAAARQRHFKGLPRRTTDDTPATVVRFKSHAAMLRLIDEVGVRRRGDDPVEVFEEMLTDRELLDEAAARWAPGEFGEEQLDKVHRWCVEQSFARTDSEAGGGDEEPTLDAEDDSILLRLHQVMVGPLTKERNKPLTYDHIMVDEAQDLSPLELAVLIETAGEGRSVTLAGDVAQKVREDRDFQDWTHVLDALSLSHVQVSPLQVSYRSTRQIMEVAREILGPLAPDEPVTTTREGAPVSHLAFTGMGDAVAWLAPALDDVMRREPTAYVALLTVDLRAAVDWYQALDRAEVPHLDLVDDQDFSFAPGIEVTDVRSSKGLEFDYVVLLGVDGPDYPIEDGARHLLHVGATRAAHQLWIVSTGRPSRLIPAGLPGLVAR